MKVSIRSAVAGFLVSLPVVSAFANTSPWFLYSTESTPSISAQEKHQSLATADSFLHLAKDVIQQCTSDAYIIVSQPNIHSKDLATSKTRHDKYMKEHQDRSITVEYGSGVLNVDAIADTVAKACVAHAVKINTNTKTYEIVDWNIKPQLFRLDFAALPTDAQARSTKLRDNVAFLDGLIRSFPEDTKFTVIHASSPVEDADVLRAHNDGLKKRHPVSDSRLYTTNQGNSSDDPKRSASLFEKYQYFTPGLFHAIMAVIIFISILSVALTAISSVKVSYLSFEKEMGPTEQKKQHL